MQSLEKLLEVMTTLLGPNGCPWDKAQTHQSLRKTMAEECQEVIEAITAENYPNLCEELGDVLINIILHAKIAEVAGQFTLDDIISGATEKLISRHTHIFGEDTAATPEEARQIWEANKKREKR